jgi:hypothetical protein
VRDTAFSTGYFTEKFRALSNAVMCRSVGGKESNSEVENAKMY